MNTSASTGIVFLLLFAAISESGASGEKEQIIQWGKEVEGVRFGIAPLQPSFCYDQPVILRMTMKNFGKEAAHVNSTNLMKQYRFDVRLPNGKPAPMTLAGTRLVNDIIVSADGPFRLNGGESDTQKLMLNRYYDMTLLGEYTVRIQRKVIPSRAGAEWVDVPSNTLKIVVREYTAEEIEQRQQQESNEK